MDQQTEAELTRWLQQTDEEATDDHSVAQAADAVANMDPAEIERMEQELRDEAHADNAGDEKETEDGQMQAASAESGQPGGTDTALPDKNAKAAGNDEQPPTTHTDHHLSAASPADHDKRETSAQQQAPPPPSAPSAPSSAAASSSETVPQSQAASARHDDQEDCIFPVRRIRFRAQTRPILCQNRNGPCPLLAICNVLLLRGQMDLPQHMEYVSFDYLTQHLSSILLDRTETAHESVRSQYEFNTTVVMDLLPKLKFGLDVNVGFSSVSKFEFTQELSAFDAFGINLYHGWVADPQEEAFPVVSELSYNQLIELVAMARDTSPASAEAQSSEKLTRAYVAEGWMTQTQSQLTYAGLTELHATLKQEELAVLFRNNHFSLLYRHKHELLTLITDIGFVGTPAVWEVLSNVEGDTFLVDADFRQIGPSSAPSSTDAALAQQLSGAVQGPGGSQAATDAELAMQLQRQEELAYQRQQQQQQQQHGGQQRQQQAAAHHAQQQAPPTGQMSDEELARYYQQQEHEAAQREQQHQHQQRQISSDAGQAGVPGYMTDEEYARQLQQQEQLAAQQQAHRMQGPAPAQGRAQQQGQQQERKKSGCLVM